MIPEIEKIIREFTSKLSGKAILDVGCGTGRDARFYRDEDFNVVGIDLSSRIIRIAQKSIQNLDFCQMDMRYLGFASKTFDGIHCWASLQHIPKRYSSLVLTNFSRLLKDKGSLLIHTRFGKGECFLPDEKYPRRFFALYNMKELTNLVARHGFLVEGCNVVQKVRFEPEIRMINLYAKKK
jgi:ubiquinone/menaquinone biosynthesis C-methylase UbiE